MDEPMSKFATALHVGRTFGMRGGMLRLGYELQRGTGLLSWKMKSVQGWDSWDLKRIAPGVTAEEMRVAQRDGTRAFFFSNPQTLEYGSVTDVPSSTCPIRYVPKKCRDDPRGMNRGSEFIK